MSQLPKPGTAFFRYQPIKSPYEPWYCGIVEKATNRTLETWYECPHCEREFKTRSACEHHCKGKAGQFPPTCPKLKIVH